MTELDAFAAVNFGWTRQLESVWRDQPYHVASFHQAAIDDLMNYFLRGTREGKSADEPLGRVVVAPAGLGKTHLMGELRRSVSDAGGTFILLDFVGIKDFWSSVALGFLNSLQTKIDEHHTQYDHFIHKAASLLLLEAPLIDIANRFRGRPQDIINEFARIFIDALMARDRRSALTHQDVARALVLLFSKDLESASIAHGWLQGMDLDVTDVRKLGFFAVRKEPFEIVNGLSWLLSLVGPTLIAVDQIDAIVSEANIRSIRTNRTEGDDGSEALAIIESLAGGLMALHEIKRRAVTVISCLESSWDVLKNKAIVSVKDRYKTPIALHEITRSDLAEAMVAARLRPVYLDHDFVPPYETWPFAKEAFETAIGFSPRQLLKACDDHQDLCVGQKEVTECFSFQDGGKVDPPPPPEKLDHVFERASKDAVVHGLSEPEHENDLRILLTEALTTYRKQVDVPDSVDVLLQPDPDQARPSLHGRLTFVFRSQGDREQHFCFRIIAHSNAIAFQTRLRAAMTASGVDHALTFRHLFILRRDPPPGGAKTQDLIAKFHKADGKFLTPTEEDLRIFVALQAMLKTNPDGFDAWLRDRKPLFKSPLFQAAGLCPPKFLAQETPSPDPGPIRSQNGGGSGSASTPGAERKPPTGPMGPASAAKPANPPPKPSTQPTPQSASRDIPLGHRFERGALGAAICLSADLLPRHVAILAGSGSGKTVLLRRLVEEAALLGLPAIVLDTNNDLARLGDSWPARPADFTDADATKAASYKHHVEVMIWTPGLNGGRPMSLALLPDFAAVRDDADERDQAIEMARATLTPYVGARGAAGKLKEGVLADTLRRFAAEGGGSLNDLIALLSDLPEDVSQIGNAQKHAAAMADQLHAAVATNPLLQSQGTPLDPRLLFGGASGKPRISVINFSGLPSDEARQAFVNQLQMSLFSWIKRNPSPTGRLYVLDEAQNFAPSARMTPCKESTVSLAAQARKYGLGMIFATQAPKGIENKIVSNCTTHFYGRMSSPTTLDATRELMAAKGGAADDIGRLNRGEFYFSSENVTRPVKIRTPLCLTYHPANPLTAEEVVAKARKEP